MPYGVDAVCEFTSIRSKFIRRSRQNGWLGTRVREPQMTCACVRVTTSEVVHRKHKDRKGSELATSENPKGEQISENQKIQSEQAEPFCRNLESRTKAQARQMSTLAASDQMNGNPTRHPKTENEKERKRKRERGRRRAGARLTPAIHYTGLLGQPVLHRAPGTPNRKTGRRRPTEEHYFLNK